jgi:Trypsin-co-occurring domain 1
MSARMLVELPGGKQLLLGGTGPATGLDEVSIGEAVVKASSEAFRTALGTLGELCAMLEQAVGRMAHRPDKVEMEFRASLSGECDLWIVSGDGEAEFKVKLAWGKGE